MRPLVVIGVNEACQRQILALQAGDKEPATAWRAAFADLIRRGLDPSTIQLGIMDGLPGLENAFRESFRKATVQRCQVHKAKNVLAKVRQKDRKIVAAGMREVFYAGDKLAAKRALERFPGKWKPMYPDAVKCIELDLEAVTAYLDFPELEWMHLRTTHLIERLHEEFKRRTKPMEIVAGGNPSTGSSPSSR